MNITTRDTGKVCIVRIDGDLDGQTAPAAQQQLVQLVRDGATRMLIDFERLAFISSAGLRTLLVTAKEIQQVNGTLRIYAANASVSEVFSMAGFDTIITVVATEQEALQGL